MTREEEIEKAITEIREVREMTRREEILGINSINELLNHISKRIEIECKDNYFAYAYAVEEKLKEIGLADKYTCILAYKTVRDKSTFGAVHASPIDRLRAALLTLEGVVWMNRIETMESISAIKSNYPSSQDIWLRKCLDNIITVLEFQIPRQAIKIDGVSSQACPICKTNVNGRYCKECGQRICY